MAKRRWTTLKVIAGVVSAAILSWQASVLLIPERLEVGGETTFITGPLTMDGHLDYAAALHQRLSVGVTPENNAAVLIDQAFGPEAISPDVRSRYFFWTGVPGLPAEGDYAINEPALVNRKSKEEAVSSDAREAMDKELGQTLRRPWTESDCPLGAEWLKLNEKPLELISQAAKRTDYYSPLVTSSTLMQSSSTSNNLRLAARLLVARAMFRLGQHDAPAAWDDLLDCHRLARLYRQRAPNLSAVLVATAIESVAVRADQLLIAGNLSQEQAEKCLVDLRSLPRIGSPFDVIDQGERMVALDTYVNDLSQTIVITNAVLRKINLRYDEIARALGLKTFQERSDALTAIEKDLRQKAAVARQPMQMAVRMSMNVRQAVSDSTTDVLLLLLIPAISQANNAETRIHTRLDLAEIAFALAAYHAEQGSYPETLDVLVPKYFRELPGDRYTGGQLVYVAREDGFQVYSLGVNGKDDGGRMSRTQDDISFEVPPREEE